MLDKETYFIKIWDESIPNVYGIGECAIFRGLSADDTPEYEQELSYICENINHISVKDIDFSSIRFGVETALNDLRNGGKRVIFNTKWLSGLNPIQINGLIWMGNYSEMLNRLHEKLEQGFNCIKLKIGGIDFNKELKILKHIRSNFSADDLQIRLDANGAFTPNNALEHLERLSKYGISSMVQYQSLAPTLEKGEEEFQKKVLSEYDSNKYEWAEFCKFYFSLCIKYKIVSLFKNFLIKSFIIFSNSAF